MPGKCCTSPMKSSLWAPPPKLRHCAPSTAFRWATASAGPSPKKLSSEFFAIVEGKKKDRHGWLTPSKSRAPPPSQPVDRPRGPGLTQSPIFVSNVAPAIQNCRRRQLQARSYVDSSFSFSCGRAPRIKSRLRSAASPPAELRAIPACVPPPQTTRSSSFSIPTILPGAARAFLIQSRLRPPNLQLLARESRCTRPATAEIHARG